MTQSCKLLLSTLTFMFALFSLVIAQAQAQNQESLLGRWKVKAETPEGETRSVWEFSQSDSGIVGSSSSDDTDEVTKFKNVNLDGGTLTFEIELEVQGTELQLDIEMELSGENIEGSWTAYDMNGNEMAAGELAGQKIAPEKKKQTEETLSGLAGEWSSIAVLPDGTESAATVSLSQSKDGKLSGYLDGENGKSNFDSVTVQDNIVRFVLQLEVSGEMRDIDIEAEIQKDGTLSGEWILVVGDTEAATGAWSAKRKITTTTLFDGKTLDGFRGYKTEEIGSGWKVVDGMLHFDGTGGGDIITTKTFKNFELSFEWKISEAGNSGVMYRVTLGDAAPYLSGIEYQILDNEKHPDGKNRTTCAASLYALYPPADKVPYEVGEWNTSKIVVNGNRIEHWLNGDKVVEAEIGSDEWKEKVAASKFATWTKFGKSPEGHIAFQDHGNPVWYRNIKIKH